MRDPRTHYAVVGAFVVAMLVALLVWIVKLSDWTRSTDPYYIVYESVMGLKEGTEIYFQGYSVGRIERIGLETATPPRFRVDVSVRSGLGIPDDSRAQVVSGIFSAVIIDIRAGDSPTTLEPGSEIRGLVAADVLTEMGEIAAQLKPLVANEAPQILEQLQGISQRISTLFDPTNVGRVARILENVERTTEDLAEVTAELGSTRAQLDGLLRRLSQVLDENRGEVDQAIEDLNHTLATVAQHVDSIAANLEDTTRNMNEFSRQIRENPGLILRGRETE